MEKAPPYEKMISSDSSGTSAILMNEPIHLEPAPVRIRHFFIFSLFSSICLCPATGLIALAYSLKSSAKADVNYHDKARLYSRYALLWNLLSVIIAIIVLCLTVTFWYQMNSSLKSYNHSSHHQTQHDKINKVLQSILNDS